MRPRATVSLFDVTSKDDYTLFEEKGGYFVNAANRTGPCQEVVQALFNDDDGWPFHDLATGDVYVAWRQFADATTSPPTPDQIMVTRSADGGKRFSVPVRALILAPMDQGTSLTSFRTNAYPTMTVDEAFETIRNLEVLTARNYDEGDWGQPERGDRDHAQHVGRRAQAV